MLDIIEFNITYERYGGDRFLRISRGISEIDKAELQLLFKRKKGERVFWPQFILATLRIRNEGYVSYNYEYFEYNVFKNNIPAIIAIKRMYLNWDPARGEIK
jgi:hypothetical protein